MTEKAKDLIVALDIGTSKVVAMIAEVLPNNGFKVIGMGFQPSKGLRKGMVVNIDDTISSIKKAIEEAELRAGYTIKEASTGIAGSHIHSFNSSGMVAVKGSEITKNDVDRVEETAKAVSIPADQEILHVIPQEYKVNDQDGIHSPIGMAGMRLEVKVHIITGSVSAVQNIVKCVRRCGLAVNDLVLQPLASSFSVLTEDEKEIGVCLIDIGGGTTDIAVFTEGSIRHTAVIPIAGDQVTNDIAMGLHTPTSEAEEIKLRYGVAKHKMVPPGSMIEIPGVGDRVARKIKRQALGAVIQPRLEELFELVKQNLNDAGLSHLIASGVVLTGGTSMLPGVADLAEEVFNMPARIAQPHYEGNLADIVCNPRYATVVGLLIDQRNKYGLLPEEEDLQSTEHGYRKNNSLEDKESIFKTMGSWFKRYF